MKGKAIGLQPVLTEFRLVSERSNKFTRALILLWRVEYLVFNLVSTKLEDLTAMPLAHLALTFDTSIWYIVIVDAQTARDEDEYFHLDELEPSSATVIHTLPTTRYQRSATVDLHVRLSSSVAIFLPVCRMSCYSAVTRYNTSTVNDDIALLSVHTCTC